MNLSTIFQRLFIVCVVPALAACATTDVASIHETEDQSFVPERDEELMWRRSERLVEGFEEYELHYDEAELEEYLQGLLDRLVASLPKEPNPRPRVLILRTPSVSAFALPHGVLYVHAGLLLHLDNETEVAIVLGHELIHYLNRHALKSKRQASNISNQSLYSQLFLLMATAGLSGMFVDDVMEWERSVTSGYSRDLEAEADNESLKLVVAAGFDATAAPGVFEKFMRVAEEQPEPDDTEKLYSSHPQLQDRLNNYRAALTRMGLPAQSNPVISEDYKRRLNPMRIELAEALIEVSSYDKAEEWIEEYLAIEPDGGQAHFLRAEVERLTNEDPMAALPLYEAAATYRGVPPAAWREIGLIHRATGNDVEATKAFEAYLEMAPDAVDAPIISSYIPAETAGR